MKTALVGTAICVGLITAAVNLEDVLELGLSVAGGNENGARGCVELKHKKPQKHAFWTPSQVKADHRSAKWEGKKLWLYYNLVSATEEKAQDLLNALHRKLLREGPRF